MSVLKEKYIIARWAYSQGKPIITDTEYDVLHKMMCNVYAKSDNVIKEYTERTWSDDQCPIEILAKNGYKDLITGEIQFYERGESIESITIERELDEYLSKFDGQQVILTPKINGWSIRVEVIDGIIMTVKSRARENNDAMTFDTLVDTLPKIYNFQKVKEQKFTGVLFGEAHLTFDNFKRLKIALPNKKAVSQVASVRTAIKELPELVTVEFFNLTEKGIEYSNKMEKYDRLKELELPVPRIWKISSNISKAIMKTIKHNQFKYLTDGIVIDAPDGTIKAIRLYDYASKLYYSVVTGLEESFNSTNIGLKLLIEPVETREGSIQTRIDIDNLARLAEFNLTKGSVVVFEKISDTVEKIHELTKGGENDISQYSN